MNSITSSNLVQFKNVVIATSLASTMLSVTNFSDEPLTFSANPTYKPVQIFNGWDMENLMGTSTAIQKPAIQTDAEIEILLNFAKKMTEDVSEIDIEIREIIDRNFWDML